MSDEHTRVAIWVGHFASERRLDQYLHETYDENREDWPISEFAADQGEHFYDHDFLEVEFRAQVTSVSQLLAGLSYSSTYLPAAERAARELGLAPGNTVVLMWGGEISSPRSVEGKDYSLRYVGDFACDPAASSREDDERSRIPDRLRLTVTRGGPLVVGGRPTKTVEVDSRGLTIGSGGSSSGPYLDLSQAPGGARLAPVQAIIGRDQFGQWTYEDVGRNGLTRIDGQVLNGERTLPWAGKGLSVGGITLTWVTDRE